MHNNKIVGLAGLTVSLMGAGWVGSASAMDFEVSGQISTAIIAADNGKRSSVGFVENAASPSRLRITGEQMMDNGMTVGLRYEMGWRRNLSSDWDIDSGNANDGESFDVRWAEGYLITDFGKFSLGRGDGAANGVTEVDFSGTSFIGGGLALHAYLGGVSLVDKEGRAIRSLGGAYQYFDALSRVSRLRYDAPRFGALSASISVDEGSAYEGALAWASKAPGGQFAAKVGYADSGDRGAEYYCSEDPACFASGGINLDYDDDKANFTTVGTSASYLLDNGLNFTVSYSDRDYDDRTNPSNYFFQLGYITGRHHWSASAGKTKNLANKGSEADALGASYVFKWSKSVELFGAYFHVQAKDLNNPYGPGLVDAKNVNGTFIGTRIKFL